MTTPPPEVIDAQVDGTPAPLASPEAEAHVLACCLLDGGQSIDLAISAGITSSSFDSPHHARIWTMLADQHRAHHK